MKLIYKKIFFTSFCFLFVSINYNLKAVEPSNYIDSSAIMYIETSNYSQVLSNINAFYKTLGIAERDGQSILDQFGLKLKKEIGLNLLNKSSLMKTGFDLNSPIGIAIGESKSKVDKTQNEEYVKIILPALDPTKLYNYILTTIQAAINSNKTKNLNKRSLPIVTEIKQGSLFHLKSKEQLFVAKGDKHLVLSSMQSIATESITPLENSISKKSYYSLIRDRVVTGLDSKNNLLFFCINPVKFNEISETSLKSFAYLLSGNANNSPSKIVDELKQNTEAIGGYIHLKPNAITAKMDYVYKKGYLNDKTKILPAFLNDDIENLRLDYFTGKPTLYSNLKIALKKYIDYFKKNDKMFEKQLSKLSKQFEENLNVKLEEDILTGLQGNFSLLIGRLPKEKDLQNSSKWQAYFSLGIKPENATAFKKIPVVIAKRLKKLNKNKKNKIKASLTKSRYRKGDLWKLSFYRNSLGNTNSSNKKKKKVKKKKIRTEVYFFITDKEIVITPNRRNLASILIKPRKPLLTRLKLASTISENESIYSIVYIDLASVVSFVESSTWRAFVAAYLPFMKKLDNISLYSGKEKDTLSTSFSIKLK